MAPVGGSGDAGGPSDDGRSGDGPDIRLSRDDRDDFREELAAAYRTESAAAIVLNQIDFPLAYRPVLQGSNPEQWWSQIFFELDAGTIGGAPYRRLLRTAGRRFPGNAVFQRLVAVYLDNRQNCHVIVWVSSELERRHAYEALANLGLEPHEFWFTTHAVSYRVNDANIERVREQLEGTDFGWTVVPAGEPDYVFHTLYARGPDGRQFRLNDTPTQQTVGNVAASVLEEYPSGYTDVTCSVVVDEVQDDGSGRRLSGDDTLHNAGIREGSWMRVGGIGIPADVRDGRITTQTRLPKIFLCHASQDKTQVRDLYQRMRSDRFELWLDSEELLPGQDWDFEIRKAVRTSRAVLVCLSSTSTGKRGYVQKEIKYALDVADEQPEGSIFLIPVRLERCEVPDRLRKWHWVDLFDEDGYAKLIRALREAGG
ncbi:toll/interleukin-1 receptor domain-containing protein [Frankia sp. Cj3]|uniref:toll/interleukin-1 receptor domain-containing protein n=1 Tax=Frankia sp. Cj3 TaxID=2880976 RepID=UPI001EF5CE8A|nr:toll/interleukin-1 receptor domain-containing protein [Frankia sp. Cj3]